MAHLKQTLMLRGFSLLKIPLLFAVSPTVVSLEEDACEVKIPLNFLTKNHLGSMYFGVLAMGADCAGGVIALDLIRKSGKKIGFIFKDFQADFLRRAEADVHFHCSDGKKIRRIIAQTLKTGERANATLAITATTPEISGDKPIAKCAITLSLKAGK